MNHYILGIPNSPLHLRTGRKRRGHKAIITEYESMQSAASAFDTDQTCIERHIHTGGDHDWKFAYTGHF